MKTKTPPRKKHPPKVRKKVRKKIEAVIGENAIGKFQRNHPWTSRDAAIKHNGISGPQRIRIFNLLWDHPKGLTDEEIQLRLDMKCQSETARRGELEKEYKVVRNSGRTRKTSSDRDAIVWVIDWEEIEL